MFRRVLGRNNKKKEKALVEPATGVNKHSLTLEENSGAASDEVPTDDSFDSSENPEPPGVLQRDTSLDLLVRATSIKNRELSSRSQARLEVVRWRSNLNCKNEKSELVPDTNAEGYKIAKSNLTIALANQVEGPRLVGEERDQDKSTPRSSPRRASAHNRASPHRQTHHETKRQDDSSSHRMAGGNAVLSQMWKESLLEKKKPRKQTRFSKPFLDQDETITSQSQGYDSGQFSSEERKRGGPFRFFGRRRSKGYEEDNEESVDASRLNDDTCLGMCFDTSCVWMFGEPTEVLDCLDCRDYGNETLNDEEKKTDKVYVSKRGGEDESVGSSRSGSSSKRRPRLISFPFRRSRSSQKD